MIYIPVLTILQVCYRCARVAADKWMLNCKMQRQEVYTTV